MKTLPRHDIIEASKEQFREIIRKNNLQNKPVAITAKTLTPEQAIGNPGRRDYPIIEGKERMIEAEFFDACGHAFTDSPINFVGYLEDVLQLQTDSNQYRAIYLATLNAVLRYLGLIQGTVHCKNDEPEHCAWRIAGHIRENWGRVRIGLIGLNPAVAEQLVKTFGSENVLITDLDRKNIGIEKYSVEIWDGRSRTEELIRLSDVVLATGTTLGNGSFDLIWELIQEHEKPYLFYGVTVAGISGIMGINRICPYGH
ncbi:MAG TPA: DUF364 domain-containing protein [Deltaproteobacteria bacterium]|nr:DUF364 domain-containing protein [Deltaproteobacteria bacterium]HPR51452.1 DUF364 domain-containing protein [Deltaproteobacteria bacterium]